MATIDYTETELEGGDERYSWTPLTETNTDGRPVGLAKNSGNVVQLLGTVGGATVAIQGSLDGTNWVTLIEFTALGLKVIPAGPLYLRPLVVGGSGTSVTVLLMSRRSPLAESLTGASGALAPGATAAAGGIPSTARLLSAAGSVNATNVKASAGRIYSIQGQNVSANARWLKLYDKATAPSDADTPRKSIILPGGTAFALDWAVGLSFANGIGYRLTTGSADNDTGALTAGDVLGLNIDYA